MGEVEKGQYWSLDSILNDGSYKESCWKTRPAASTFNFIHKPEFGKEIGERTVAAKSSSRCGTPGA
jgi:hypothetical protein